MCFKLISGTDKGVFIIEYNVYYLEIIVKNKKSLKISTLASYKLSLIAYKAAKYPRKVTLVF